MRTFYLKPLDVLNMDFARYASRKIYLRDDFLHLVPIIGFSSIDIHIRNNRTGNTSVKSILDTSTTFTIDIVETISSITLYCKEDYHLIRKLTYG